MKLPRLLVTGVAQGINMVFWISQQITSRPVQFKYNYKTMNTWRLTTRGLFSCLGFLVVFGLMCIIYEGKTDTTGSGSPLFRYLQSIRGAFTEQLMVSKLLTLNESVQVLLKSRDLNPLYEVDMTANLPDEKICYVYSNDGTANRTAIPRVWDQFMKYDDNDITLVTQLSLDRLPLINRSLHHWTGPFSIAVYVDEGQLTSLLDIFKQTPLILSRSNVDVHLVLKSGTFYPVNYLRNTALNHSRTHYVYLTDADLIPKKGLHEEMKIKLSAGVLAQQQALVVPAFETSNGALPYPVNKTQLLTSWAERQIIPFFFDRWNNSHAPSQYERWKVSTIPYAVEYKEFYEPYIIMRRLDVPAYNQKFVGWYRDKISHLLEIHMRNFTYVVLDDVYTIHYPHETAPDGGIRKQYFKCALDLYSEHLDHLKQLFPGRLSFNSVS